MDDCKDPQVEADHESLSESFKAVGRAVERFFWNLMWFVVFVFILFSFNPFR